MESMRCPLFLIFIVVFHQVTAKPTGDVKCYQLTGEHEKDNNIKKRQVECPEFVQGKQETKGRAAGPPVLTAKQREERKRRIFEGLLHFATVVNHIDSFVMDKGKLFLKSLGKMVASEEDTRFDM